MWVFDKSTLRFLAVNDAAVEAYGWSREEFLAMDLRDIRPPEDRTALEQAVASAAPGIERSSRWRHLTKAGQVRQVEVASHDVEFDGRDARLAVAHDLTERLDAERAMQESEERFRLLSRATTDAVWDWDLATDSIWWSDGLEQLFGVTHDAAVATGAQWAARIHPDDRVRVWEGIQAVIRGSGDAWNDEYRFARADGGFACVQDRGFVIRRADGTPVRMVGGMTDVTERRALEQQVLRAQRLESIGTLAGGIAHDLNNMLSPILMSLDLLRDHVDSEEGRDLIDAIEGSAQRGAELVRQVLTYARGVDGQRAPLAVRDLVRDLTRILLDTFPKEVAFRTELPDDLWAVIGDRTQLQQVLMNLCVNARDAMPDGGILRIHAVNLRLDAREASAMPDARAGTFVRLSVEDDGEGIPARVLDRVFEPFFTTKPVGKGTGLGLSTVQAIVRSHGGFVTVQSAPGGGTTFAVHLPADPDATATHGARRRPTPSTGSRQLVLLVDDEPHVRAFTAELLGQAGYRALEAADTAEAAAILAARGREIALVIADAGNGGPRGLDAAAARSLRAAAPAVPLIAMTGDPLRDLGDGLRGAPGVLPLLKPFSAAQLEDAVRRALALRRGG